MARKEARQASRDPLSLAMLLGLPTIMLLMYGYAINFDVRHVRLAVRDLDKTAESRNLISSFVNSTYFDEVAEVPAGADVDLITERRVAKAVLAIPEGFARTLDQGRTASIQLLLDGADANTATTVLGYATALAADVNLRRYSDRSGIQVIPIGYEPRVFYNPELRTTQFLVPGLVGFILMLTAVVSTALSVVRAAVFGFSELWPVFLPLTIQRARLAVQLGDRETAVTAYSLISEAWSTADPVLQPFVTEAKRELTRLGGDTTSARRLEKKR